MSSIPIFPASLERNLWVQAQLRLMGRSFSTIARKHGWTRGVVGKAMLIPSDPQEKAIAEELGVTQQELFPERFDAAGNRLHHVRQNTNRRGPDNVKKPEAA